ncbi:hypothetical protein HU200_011746 [Digitaria exilis]|uniref:Uncharacterized protein n=1 Tax=Digitaria exilis TaxID=1010633 RepID=A0A835KME4_9POAL|nr:hypothetical protein HU200_011746 [Digitaria exilis]
MSMSLKLWPSMFRASWGRWPAYLHLQLLSEAPLVEDSMQSCMPRGFGAMESFAVASENAYEQGSYIRAEEEKARHDDQANGGPLDVDITSIEQEG